MVTVAEYAALAARVYVATPKNRIQVFPGWEELQHIPDRELTGFSAGVYKKGDEIVIAYTGTNEGKVADFTVANLPAAGPLPSAQVWEAMELYLEVKQANPGATITFTGHSLGGGLASMMAVFFDRPATTFDSAPFQVGAVSPVALATYAAQMALYSYSDAAFDSYIESVGNVFAQREGAVTGYWLQNEALAYLRAAPVVATIMGEGPGQQNEIPIGNASLTQGSALSIAAATVKLHSMVLLASMLQSERFAAVIALHPTALELFFDIALYASDPDTSAEANFLNRLLNNHLSGNDANGTRTLDRFAADLELLVAGGSAGTASLQKALTVAAMEYYYFKDPGSATALFSSDAGGLHFKYSDIGTSSYKSLPLLVSAVQAQTGDNTINALGSLLIRQDAWHIQAGDAGMTWTGTGADNDAAIGGEQSDALNAAAGDDILYGLGGADTLQGGAGVDFLYGGEGDDVLDGGDNADWLTGGVGDDTYRFTGSWGRDTVEDSDGQGTLAVEGLGPGLPTGKKISEGFWQTDDKRISYTLVTVDAQRNDLLITFSDRPDVIQIQGWSSEKSLGITLDEATTPTEPLSPLIGDLEKEKSSDGDSYRVVNNGGYVSSGVQANAQDILIGTSSADDIRGVGGNDGIAAGGGDDTVDGGDGDDLIFGGTGRDTLNGGAGNDLIYGSAVGDIDRPVDVDFEQPTVTTGVEVTRGFSWLSWRADVPRQQGDQTTLRLIGLVGADASPIFSSGGEPDVESSGNVIDGGSGNDYIAAGTGADIVHGGDDDDDILGLRGDDLLFGDGGDDIIDGDGSAGPDSPEYTAPEDHGNDVLVGGAGNDALVGSGGADELYGGTDNDLLWGDDMHPDETPNSIHGDDYLDGGSGVDRLSGGGRNDTLFGGTGNDALWGDGSTHEGVSLSFHGADHLDGEDGNDDLHGGGADDVLIGGTGDDRLWGDDDTDDSFDTAYHGQDWLDGGAGNDHLEGGAKADTLHGGTGADTLLGDGRPMGVADYGDDYLDGGDDDDHVQGDGGADTLFGGAGDDTVRGDDSLTLLVGAAHGDDHLDGGEGNDQLFGDGGADVLFGGAGNDQLTGDSGDGEEFTVFDGDDYLDGEAGDDTLFGQGGNDQLYGGEGNDHLQGGIGDDLLDGGDGEDVLLGGDGNDTLVSDGRDYLDGGAGNDAYEITVQNSGVVAVINDAQGTNTIRLLGAPAGDAAVFAYEGKTFLAAGSAGAVALGDNANFAGLSLMADDGASGRTLQAIINDSSVHGLARSAQWSASGGVRYTRDELFAQNIVGGARGEWLEGGYGSHTISGGAGADRLDGGVGADLLDGGAGADVLNGGTGADTLRGGSGTDTLDGGDDFNRDVYVFARGDGEDRIVRTALPEGAAKDVIRFEAGITAGDVALRNVAQSQQGTPVESLVISYGLGDRITLEQGAQNTIDRLEFADGTSLTITELLSPLAPDASSQDGTTAADVLVGTPDGNDYLRGWGGDDTLQGEAGDDVLQGGTGRNTYRFTGDSGNDTIFASLGEEGTLVFEGVTPAEVAARIDEGRLVVSAGNSTVQVIGLPSIAQASQSWQVQIGNEPPVSLGALLSSSELPPVEQDDRRGQFLSAQRIELDEMEQRQGLGLNPGQSGVVPSHVRTAAYGLAAPGVLELPGYLSEVDGTTTITRHYTEPIYRAVFTPADNSDEGFFEYRFVPIEDLLGIHDLPEGSHLVYGRSFPSDGGGSSSGQQVIGVNIHDTAFGDVDLVVAGYRTVTRQEVRRWTSDTATQMLVTGTAGDDTFVPGAEDAQFRGSIEAGAGNDVIRLLSYRNTGPERGALLRTQDWAPVPYAFADYPSWSLYERRRGAWIDAGDGDDTVSGTDAHDVIIGGHGSDWMDGQAGEDTYLISRDPESTDHIADVAAFPASGMDPVYGPAVDDLHQDTVEFDDTVDLAQLSYRWNGDTLELLQANELFLEIDYGNGPIGEPGSGGIERFVFSDGQAFTLTQLLDRLDSEARPPVLLTPLPDLSLTEDTPFAGPPLQALFEDPQGQALTFSAQLAGGAPLPDWLSFDPLTAALSATPSNDQVGGLRIEVTATDSDGLSVASEFNLTVANVNDAPQAGDAWPAAAFVEEGHAFHIDLPAGAFVDVDAADVLSYSATLSSGEPLPAWLSIDPATGSLTGEAPAGEQGTLAIELHATDLAGATAAASFSLEVGAVSQIVNGSDASDVLSGGSGSDQISGGLGDDQLAGLEGDDLLAGEGGADALDGGAGNDVLYGGADADTLNGGLGDDVLSGGAGNDMLVDTEGHDVYVFGRGDGRDWIAASETLSGSTSPAEPGRINTLRFDAGISPDDIELRRTVDPRWGTEIGGAPDHKPLTLQVGIAGTDDVVNISRYFLGDDPANGFNPIQRFEFADGTVWSYEDIAAQGFTGTAAPDLLFGTTGNDNIDGRGGNDAIVDDLGNDTYHLGIGSGSDRILDWGGQDVLRIGAGIDAEQLWFRDVEGSLEVSVIGTSDSVLAQLGLVPSWLADTHIDRIELSDGRYLLDADVANLVQAMAAFAPPQPGETTLPESYRQDLAPVIAANWHTS